MSEVNYAYNYKNDLKNQT